MTGLICGNCTALFTANQSPQQAAKLAVVMQCPNECWSEQLSVSAHSPGVVANDEELVGCICHPNHTQNGNLHYKFFDAAFAHGMSVTRKSYRPDWADSVEEFCDSVVCNTERGREYHALGSFHTGSVREVLYDNCERAFYVFDTATAKNIAHADVVSFRYPGKSTDLSVGDRQKRMIAQMQLLSAVTEGTADQFKLAQAQAGASNT